VCQSLSSIIHKKFRTYDKVVLLPTELALEEKRFVNKLAVSAGYTVLMVDPDGNTRATRSEEQTTRPPPTASGND
jgi:hypothetical protein